MRTILKTLLIILNLKNTINVNVILYGIRRIPLIGKHIPEQIHGIRIFKIYASVLSINYEIIKAFFGELCLFAVLFLFSILFNSYISGGIGPCAFLYAFLFASFAITASFNVFKVTTETEYAVFCLGTDPQKYIFAKIAYQLFKIFAGYTVFGIPAAAFAHVKWYMLPLIPFAGAGFITLKIGLKTAFLTLKYSSSKNKEKKVTRFSVEGNLLAALFFYTILFLAMMVAIPWAICNNFILVASLITLFFALSFVPGLLLIKKCPYDLYKIALSKEKEAEEITKEASKKRNSLRPEVKINSTSKNKSDSNGYRFLNELFFKRHTKTLSVPFVFDLLMTVGAMVLLSLLMRVELKHTFDTNRMIMRFIFSTHPAFYFFMMLCGNMGAKITYAMYTNCDSTFLKFSFYRKPDALIKMYRLRIMSVIKFNLPQAVLMSVYSVVVIFVTGGEDYFLQCVCNVLILLSSMILFSVRHMAIYYLLQPYAEKIKGMKTVVYFILYSFYWAFGFVALFLKIPAYVLAPLLVLYTAFYVFAADGLVKKFAVKTFIVK